MLAGASPPRTDDDDRLRLPTAPPPHNGKAEKKESAAHRLSQLCPPYAALFSHCSPDRLHNAVHIVENGYATGGGLNRKCQSSARRPFGSLRNLRSSAQADQLAACNVLVSERVPCC